MDLCNFCNRYESDRSCCIELCRIKATSWIQVNTRNLDISTHKCLIKHNRETDGLSKLYCDWSLVRIISSLFYKSKQSKYDYSVTLLLKAKHSKSMSHKKIKDKNIITTLNVKHTVFTLLFSSAGQIRSSIHLMEQFQIVQWSDRHEYIIYFIMFFFRGYMTRKNM